VLLNSQLQEFSPDLVMYAVHAKITKSGNPNRFPNIDVVVYISEKHSRILPDGRIAFAIASLHCASIIANPWKAQFDDLILRRWSHFRTGGDFVAANTLRDFEPVEDIPRMMKRHEFWRLEYRRNPYMRSLSDEQLKVVFNRCVAQSAVAFVKGDWQAPPVEETRGQMRLMSHLVEETNRRGSDLRSFSPGLLSPENRSQILHGLPAELADMFTKSMQSKPDAA